MNIIQAIKLARPVIRPGSDIPRVIQILEHGLIYGENEAQMDIIHMRAEDILAEDWELAG